jgi:hypothetical protein
MWRRRRGSNVPERCTVVYPPVAFPVGGSHLFSPDARGARPFAGSRGGCTVVSHSCGTWGGGCVSGGGFTDCVGAPARGHRARQRYVAFWSFASNLVPGDTNGTSDVFVRDRGAGTIERVSVDSRERQAAGGDQGGVLDTNFGRPVITPDGRFRVVAKSEGRLCLYACNSRLSALRTRVTRAGLGLPRLVRARRPSRSVSSMPDQPCC